MTGFGKPGKWQRAMMVATGIGVLGAFLTAPLAEAGMVAPAARYPALRLQDETPAQPSQVGEGDADTEPMDQGSPPAASGDDIETLDQGSPPAGVPVPVADGTVLNAPAATPATTGAAYTEPAGPQLPPGFGEGRVLVSNNPRGFPVGLEPCEVGAVTGRAYVGVKCGDDRDPIVGHSTYDGFPWVIDPGFPFEPGADVVTDPSFPFDEDSPFFESFLDRTTDSDVVVLVAPRGFPFDDDDEARAGSSHAPAVTSGGVVSLAQPARKERNRERTRVNGSASSGDVARDPDTSRTRRSTSKKQGAKVSSESSSGKATGGRHSNKAKASKNKKSKQNKKQNRKGEHKKSKKQRAKQGKRNK
ncbi:MAG: hypothetical protein KC432_12815 [Thermomicrobiales bacterium]|nr:hypothetical protein [Thermomicrobiales bacterium]